jgi:hypothetical protein
LEDLACVLETGMKLKVNIKVLRDVLLEHLLLLKACAVSIEVGQSSQHVLVHETIRVLKHALFYMINYGLVIAQHMSFSSDSILLL